MEIRGNPRENKKYSGRFIGKYVKFWLGTGHYLWRGGGALKRKWVGKQNFMGGNGWVEYKFTKPRGA
jgi:hypothetical protein